MDNNSADLQSQLTVAYGHLKGNQPKIALAKLNEIKVRWPNNCDIEHLIALSYKSLGDLELSKQHFLRSLAINSKQPELHNNLANLFKSQGQLVEAEKHYLQALSLHPEYLQAQRNLAICYQAQGDYAAAIAAYCKATDLSPNDVSSLNGTADCLRLMGDSIAAHDIYKRALAIDPQSFKSWHNLGLNFHLQGQLGEAIDCYRKAHAIAPNVPEVTESLALSLYESGDVTTSIALFNAALEIDPGNAQLHERYNSMLWQTEYADQFGHSYEAAITRLVDSRDVELSYASMLYQAGRVQQAKSVISASELRVSEHHQVLSLSGQIDAELGNYDSAYESLAASLQQQFSKDVAAQMVKIDIILERYNKAQSLLAKMFSNSPECQLTWALQSLVWRLSGDARYQWLCDYKQFIKTYELAVPAAYASLDDFLLSIRDELNPLHRNENEPLEQTLRNGSQTPPRLLHTNSAGVQALKDSLSTIVASYIDGLQDDPQHPLLGRKSSQFEFSGSWSVKLRANGFHVNHVHTDGWISSSCYITLPDSTSCGDDLDPPHQGYIKFGESPLQLGEREQIELSLEPKPGMVVLFPSYFWHGTYPFSGGESDYRLTAPFDVVPR